jgi:hypothetical protein
MPMAKSRHKKTENVRRYLKPSPEAIAEVTSLLAPRQQQALKPLGLSGSRTRSGTYGSPEHDRDAAAFEEPHDVLEVWDSANKDLFYGKDGDLAGGQGIPRGRRSCAAPAPVRSGPRRNAADRSGFSPTRRGPTLLPTLTGARSPRCSGRAVNPYGRFERDMHRRLDLDLTARRMPGPRAGGTEPAALSR